MCITEHCQLQAKLLKVFQNSKQNMMGSEKDVRKEIIQRRHFLAVKAKLLKVFQKCIQNMNVYAKDV